MNLQHHLISARCRPDVNETSKVRIYNIFIPSLLNDFDAMPLLYIKTLVTYYSKEAPVSFSPPKVLSLSNC